MITLFPIFPLMLILLLVTEYVAAFYLDLVRKVNEILHRFMRNHRQRHRPDFQGKGKYKRSKHH